MPLDNFLKALETIKRPARHFTVVLTGGEPLLRDDLELCGREIRKRGMRWSMVTNGMRYTEEKHASLLSAGLGALTISLDGLEGSHNWLRNNLSSFSNAVRAIALAAGSRRLNFDVVTCVNPQNIDELGQVRELLISLKVRSWRLFTIFPIGRAAENRALMLDNRQFVRLMDFIAASRKTNSIDVKFSCEGYVGTYESLVRDTPFFCRAGINIASVLADGSISACPNIDRAFVQGNIYSDDLFHVWQTRFQAFRDREWTRTGTCKDCKEYSRCLGNGLHNWQGDLKQVQVCHHGMIARERQARAYLK